MTADIVAALPGMASFYRAAASPGLVMRLPGRHHSVDVTVALRKRPGRSRNRRKSLWHQAEGEGFEPSRVAGFQDRTMSPVKCNESSTSDNPENVLAHLGILDHAVKPIELPDVVERVEELERLISEGQDNERQEPHRQATGYGARDGPMRGQAPRRQELKPDPLFRLTAVESPPRYGASRWAAPRRLERRAPHLPRAGPRP